MPSPNLPENVDSSYPDEPTDPSVEIHQEHHDEIHKMLNKLDTNLRDGSQSDGDVPVYRTASGTYVPEPVSGTQGPQGVPGADGADGVGYLDRGAWNSGTTYHIHTFNDPDAYEIVRFNGARFKCLLTNTNVPPDPTGDTATWEMFVDRGADGVDGQNGEIGPTGPQGDPGVPGPSQSVAAPPASVSGVVTFDVVDADAFPITLADDAEFNLRDTSGATHSAITFRLIMGAGGPYTIDWPDIPSGGWRSTNNAVDGEPPDLTVMNDGDELVITVDQMHGSWRGYMPGSTSGGPTPPPPPGFPTLAMEYLASTYSRALRTIPAGGGAISWTGSAFASGFLADGATTNVLSAQIRPRSGAVAWVLLDKTASFAGALDPGVPVLDGYGVPSGGWIQIGTMLSHDFSPAPTGNGRLRRLTCFVAREIAPGAASGPTVTVPTPGVAGDSYEACAVYVVQTSVDVASSWITQAENTAITRGQDTGPSATTELPNKMRMPVSLTDAADRVIVGVYTNLNRNATGGPGGGVLVNDLVPETGAVKVGIGGVQIGGSPNCQLWALWDPSAFDTSTEATFTEGSLVATPDVTAASADWMAIGFAMEQA